MSIEYRGDGKYRFRMQKDGISYSQNYYCDKKPSEEDIKKKNYPKEITDAHKKFEVDILRGEIGSNENMKFSELIQLVNDEHNKANLRASTIRRCMSFYDVHFLPAFGDMPISKIKPLHIQKFINELKQRKNVNNEPLSLRTVKSIVKELNKVFNTGIRWKIITENPAKDFKIDVPIKKYSELLPLEEIKKLMQAIDKMDNIMYKCIFTIALYSGIREGENIGLCLRYVNSKEGYIDVMQQYGEVMTEDSKFTRELTDTKTPGSVRRVYALQIVFDVIKEYVAYKKIIDLDAPLFINESTGKPFTRETITARFRKLLKDNNIPPIRLHDARHLNATLQIASGVDPVTVALALGDNVETILNNYTHSISDIQKKSVEQLDNFLEQIK